MVFRAIYLAVIQRLQLLDTLPHTLDIPENVAVALRDRLSCCRLSSHIQVIAVKEISEKCTCIDGFGLSGFLFLVRFPTKLSKSLQGNVNCLCGEIEIEGMVCGKSGNPPRIFTIHVACTYAHVQLC